MDVRIPESVGDLGDSAALASVRRKIAASNPRAVVVAVDRDSRVATCALAAVADQSPPVRMRLADGVRDTAAAGLCARIEATYPGWTLVAFDAAAGTATRAAMDPVTFETRAQMARVLGCPPWQITVIVEVVDGELDEVWIEGPGLTAVKVEARAKLLEHAAKQVVGHNGWRVVEDHARGTARLVRGAPIDIPVKAPIVYEDFGSRGPLWLPFGVDGRQKPVAVDLAATPHALVVGKTGSGKTILLQSLAVGMLAGGGEIAVVDPTKAGLDFLPFRPWVRPGGWGCASMEAAAQVLIDIYAEAMRRKALLQELERPKVWALTDAERSEHNIRPILVIVDEGTSLAKEVPVPKALPKDDPERLELESLNLAKARIMSMLGRYARELRFVGVSIVLGTQRFDVANFGAGAGELRENLGARVILGRASRTALGMACSDGEAAVAAHELAHGVAASDGETTEAVVRPGRGITEIDGLGTIPFQGRWSTESELVAWLGAHVARRAAGLPLEPTIAPAPSAPASGGRRGGGKPVAVKAVSGVDFADLFDDRDE